MESVGSSEEEVKLNNPVPEPHIIPMYFLFHFFFSQESNPSAKEAKENLLVEREVQEEARIICHVEKGEKHHRFIWGDNYGVSWKS